VAQRDWAGARYPEVYIPLAQHQEVIGRPHTSSMTVVARSAGDSAALRNALASQVTGINSQVPATQIQTLEEVAALATQRMRVFTALLAVFAVSAVALAAIGLYGVVAWDAGRRTQEMGVRIALGARPSDVTALVVRDAAWMVLCGGVIGLAGSLAVSRSLASLLYGVEPTDAATICAVVALFVAVCAFAAYVPARRAARLDPVHALRSE
jgi:putative ABC transport system permease protein